MRSAKEDLSLVDIREHNLTLERSAVVVRGQGVLERRRHVAHISGKLHLVTKLLRWQGAPSISRRRDKTFPHLWSHFHGQEISGVIITGG